MNTIVQLFPLDCSDRDQFILDNQEAFNYGAMEEFGLRDDHFEEEDQIIFQLKVAPSDMGKVIGKQGRIAKAIRTVVKAAAMEDNKKVDVDII